MSDENLLTRREFTVESALAMLAGVTITITGCGGDNNNNAVTNPTPQPTGGKTGTVGTANGHTHSGADITAAQLVPPQNAISLTLSVVSGHSHTVALSQSELSQIAANTRVQKDSSNDAAHVHTVTFN
jgi:hypothetical protein